VTFKRRKYPATSRPWAGRRFRSIRNRSGGDSRTFARTGLSLPQRISALWARSLSVCALTFASSAFQWTSSTRLMAGHCSGFLCDLGTDSAISAVKSFSKDLNRGERREKPEFAEKSTRLADCLLLKLPQTQH